MNGVNDVTFPCLWALPLLPATLRVCDAVKFGVSRFYANFLGGHPGRGLDRLVPSRVA